MSWQQDLKEAGELRAQAAPDESEPIVSAKRGRHLYQETGCVTCHSLDGSRKVGPSFQGLYGAKRTTKSGETLAADEDYLRQSILHPTRHVTAGYQPNMPSYRGVLSDSEIESLIAFIESLDEATPEQETP